jgi:hypothetical protein
VSYVNGCGHDFFRRSLKHSWNSGMVAWCIKIRRSRVHLECHAIKHLVYLRSGVEGIVF